jgi:putative endonuclease
MPSTQQRGQLAEELASQYLQQQGMKLLDRNYHCRFGELDLIMQDKKNLVFIEVRYRSNPAFGSGAETITTSKRSKLVKTAAVYLQQHVKLAKYPARFDVISMSGQLQQPVVSNELDKINIEWIENAFDA